jgi:zinc protease
MLRSMRRYFLGVLFLPIICQSAFGQTSSPVEKHVLDNGLTVLISEDHSAPVVTYQVWFKVGSRNERPGITGISHVCEHMMFKGSKNFGPEEHPRLIKANGGIYNAGTWFDWTFYYEKLASEKLELAINLESERHKNLTPTLENFTSEREVIKEERRTTVDNSPFGAVFEQLLNTACAAHPYHWHIVSYMSDIDGITLEDVKNQFHLFFLSRIAIKV